MHVCAFHQLIITRSPSTPVENSHHEFVKQSIWLWGVSEFAPRCWHSLAAPYKPKPITQPPLPPTLPLHNYSQNTPPLRRAHTQPPSPRALFTHLTPGNGGHPNCLQVPRSPQRRSLQVCTQHHPTQHPLLTTL